MTQATLGYLESVLDTAWEWSVDYCQTEPELRLDHRYQNDLRGRDGLRLLTDDHLAEGIRKVSGLSYPAGCP